MAVMAALIRGLARAGQRTIGNFWVDLVRTTIRILLPIAFVFAIVLVATGVIQNTHGFTEVHTVAGATQQIPGGPNASMESIKQLGTNGGDFFNVNSAHPFSNPTELSDFLELYAILIIPFALAFTFGRMVKDKRQGYAVFAVMFVIWLGVQPASRSSSRSAATRSSTTARRDADRHRELAGRQRRRARRSGSGRPRPALWCASTTGTSNGSVNSMHDSYTPVGRHGPARAHEARRGQPRRRRRRPQRPARSSPSSRCSSPGSWSGEHRSTWARRSRPPR